jgi:8-oxo-dGTP pyrophosphatase MutT (NUDIX family)
MPKPPWFYQQSGVIPYRIKGRAVEILLITSRRRGRWIIPKGIIDPGTTAIESACKEAYEEAGIRGRPSATALGKYQYDKWGGTCTVEVFALEVSSVLETWPESGVRRRQWMSVGAAAKAIEEPALKRLISGLRPLISDI